MEYGLYSCTGRNPATSAPGGGAGVREVVCRFCVVVAGCVVVAFLCEFAVADAAADETAFETLDATLLNGSATPLALFVAEPEGAGLFGGEVGAETV